MEFYDVLKRRKSIRRFKEEQLTEEDLKKLLEAAEYAPVGSNRRQDIHLTIVRDPAILCKLSEATWKRAENKRLMKEIAGTVQISWEQKHFDPFYGAPLVIFISHRRQSLQPGIEYANAACVAETLHLAAGSLRLGSVMIWGALEAMREIPSLDHTDLLELPEDFQPVMGLAVGYPQEIPGERPGTAFSANYL